jgi:tetratricopeptide (TPR) repeat protein
VIIIHLLAFVLISTLALTSCAGLHLEDHRQRWQRADEKGVAAVQEQKYDLAEESFKEAVSEASLLGDLDPRLIESMNQLADTYFRRGKADQARETYLSVLNKQERIFPKDSISLVPALNNVVRVTCAGGKCAATLPYLSELLVIRIKAFGFNHHDVLITLDLIGEAHEKDGNYPQALAYFQKARSICETTLGPSNPSTLSALTNIARVYEKEGDFLNAKKTYEHALAQQKGANNALVVQSISKHYQELLRKSGDKNKGAAPVLQPAPGEKKERKTLRCDDRT